MLICRPLRIMQLFNLTTDTI
uniref:Uncharacterized protein n=1 Tax=Rhizophora mucronata TaxID=61149 RepID=A0A2P2NV91_RHIMU